MRDRFARQAKTVQREIAVDAPDGPPVELDPLRIEQALGNLVDNALVHGSGDVRLSAREADGFVVLEVSDQGSGFATGFEDEAFERFSRADGGRRGGGAGLGLAIVRAIAVSHGGTVSVVSDPGNSTTTLQVRLPLELLGLQRLRGRRLAVDVLAHPVGALLERQRLLANARQSLSLELREVDQLQHLLLVLLGTPPPHPDAAHLGRVVLELEGARLRALELLDDQDVLVAPGGNAGVLARLVDPRAIDPVDRRRRVTLGIAWLVRLGLGLDKIPARAPFRPAIQAGASASLPFSYSSGYSPKFQTFPSLSCAKKASSVS